MNLLDDIKNHFIAYLFILAAIVFGFGFKQGVVGLSLFSFAIGILIGQGMPKD